MEWILIIFTALTPHAEGKLQEVVMPDCPAVKERIELVWQDADPAFTHTLRCEKRRKKEAKK